MQKPPTFLYHYTTQPGLIGIIESKSLWATKIHFLNDSSEYELALSITKDLIETRVVSLQPGPKQVLLKELNKNIYRIQYFNACVCSFSTQKDLLSQWRAYAGSNGYALAFFTGQLQEKAEKNGFRLVPCVYDPDEQNALINDVVDQMLAELEISEKFSDSTKLDSMEFKNFINGIVDNYIIQIGQVAPLIKSPGFREENEWRLVSNEGVNYSDMHFRSGTSTIIPYALFDLGPSITTLLHSIIIGPTPNPILAKDGAFGLLYKAGIRHGNLLIHSEIPYRSW